MKKYTLKYDGWESLEEDLSEDVIFFHCIIAPENQQPFILILPYHKFKNQLKDMEPGIYELLKKAENETEKWGPHESEILHELISYGIDLEPIVINMFKQTYNIEAEIEHKAKMKTNPVKLNKMLAEMDEAAANLKAYNNYYYSICNTIEKAITNAMIEQFPVIMNSSTDCIKKLKSVLVKHIPKLADDLNQLVQEAEES